MPLRDHFRSPVNDTHSWDEVHGQWPGEIVQDLAKILPAGFFAAPKVHLGSPFGVDVSRVDYFGILFTTGSTSARRSESM